MCAGVWGIRRRAGRLAFGLGPCPLALKLPLSRIPSLGCTAVGADNLSVASCIPSCSDERVRGNAVVSTNGSPARVLILGGTGRAGAKTARALSRMAPCPVSITIAGRNKSKGQAVVQDSVACQHGNVVSAQFQRVDIDDFERLLHMVKTHDIIVHTAGPFQNRKHPNLVLKATIQAGKYYIDICDDVCHASHAKSLMEKAARENVRAIICAGIYPGVSNLATAEAVSRLPGKSAESIQLFYYTAGSGGTGATVLASTFLILSENAMCYDRANKLVLRPAACEQQLVDFGGKIGPRTTFLLNLPEVVSLHETLLQPKGGGKISAKLGIGPPIWNTLLQVMARIIPRRIIGNFAAMRRLAFISLPFVRLVDCISGARTAFLVKVKSKQNQPTGKPSCVTVSYEHENLAQSVGEATAAFASEMLRDFVSGTKGLRPGVYYPEELDADVRQRIFDDAVRTADRFVLRETTNT